MGLDCCGNISNLILGAGLGILAVTCLTVTIMFGQYYANFGKTDMKIYQIQDPAYWDYDIYNCSLVITIFGAISAVAAIAAFLLSIFLFGNKIVLIIAGGVSAVLAIGCLVTEGVFYHYKITRYVTDRLTRLGGKPYYRNNTKAQDYIKEVIQDLYTQGITNVKEYLKEHDSEELAKHLKDWTSISSKIGVEEKNETEDPPTLTILNYADFWNGDVQPDRLTLKADHCFDQSNQMCIFAQFQPERILPTISVVVASLNFNVTKDVKLIQKRLVCWNQTNSADYDCKELEQQVETGYSGLIYDMSGENPWALNQQVLVKDKYFTQSQIDESPYEISYEYYVEKFPIFYRKMTYSEYTDEKNKSDKYDVSAFYYTEDTKHFKFSASEFVADYKVFSEKQDYQNMDKYSNFYWCYKEPSDWDQAFKFGNETDYCDTVSSPTNVFNLPISYPDALRVAYDMINIGQYPSFVFSYLRRGFRDQVFPKFGEFVYRLAFDSMIIQIAAIILLVCGIIFYGSGDGSQNHSIQHEDLGNA